MRIHLFSVLAVSALLAPTAAAQAPVTVTETSTRYPAPDESVRAAQAPADPDVARPRSRLWVTNEMLTWWVQGMQLPVLISTSLPGTPTASAGVLGIGGNTSVVGPTNADDNVRLGWRLTMGGWLGDDHRVGIEVQFLTLANGGTLLSALSPGNPILARPIVNAVT